MYYGRHTTILAVLVGLFVIWLALMVIRAAFRQTGQGDCLTGCCLFELGNMLLDTGCGLVGCGGLLGAFALAILGLVGFSHR